MEIDIDKIFSLGEVSDDELQTLLEKREKKEIDFKLIDIREEYEYIGNSIADTDLLYPTSKFHIYVKELKKIQDEYILLYCRTGNRTAQALKILRRMGFEKIAHLSRGIVEYSGKKVKNGTIPNSLN